MAISLLVGNAMQCVLCGKWHLASYAADKRDWPALIDVSKLEVMSGHIEKVVLSYGLVISMNEIRLHIRTTHLKSKHNVLNFEGYQQNLSWVLKVVIINI
jgi:hypothetical protein